MTDPQIHTREITEREVHAPGLTYLVRTTGTGSFLRLLVTRDSGGPVISLAGSQLRVLYRLLNAGAAEATE